MSQCIACVCGDVAAKIHESPRQAAKGAARSVIERCLADGSQAVLDALCQDCRARYERSLVQTAKVVEAIKASLGSGGEGGSAS